MKTLSFLLVLVSLVSFGCATGENSSSYSTVLGDITIVDNGGTNTTSKTNSADVGVAGQINDQVEEKVGSKLKEKAE